MLTPRGNIEFNWVAFNADADVLPDWSVQGGFDFNGKPLYIARAMFVKEWHCGYYAPSLKQAVIGWNVKAYFNTRFQIIVVS